MKSRNTIHFIVLSLLIVALFIVDLAVGSVAIPLREVWAALTGGEVAASTAKIVCSIRLVKAVVALVAGAALAVSGLQMQTLFRNPMAGPYVLGVSGRMVGGDNFPLYSFRGSKSDLRVEIE